MLTSLAEAYSASTYRSQLRSAIRGLWTGALSKDEFVEAMEATIRRGLSRAFEEGAKTWGLKPDELDDEELAARDQIIDAEGGYVRPLADDILAGSKTEGGKLDTYFYRAELWAAKYDQVVQRAKILTGENQKLEWVYDPSKEHCPDCAKLNGKVKRAKEWDAAGLFPKSRRLKCRGYHCGCDLEPTTKPITKGRLPQPTYAAELMAAAVEAELVKLVALGTPVEMAMEMARDSVAWDSVLDGLQTENAPGAPPRAWAGQSRVSRPGGPSALRGGKAGAAMHGVSESAGV